MFSSPVRSVDANGSPVYTVAVVDAKPLGLRLNAPQDMAIIPDFETAQSALRNYRKQILSELVNHRSLFRTPPSIESLEAITPNWGFLLGEKSGLNPYITLVSSIPTTKFPAIVDFQLKSLQISRTTIKPTFELVYVCPVKQNNPVIDFSWDADDEEVEEEDVLRMSKMRTRLSRPPTARYRPSSLVAIVSISLLLPSSPRDEAGSNDVFFPDSKSHINRDPSFAPQNCNTTIL